MKLFSINNFIADQRNLDPGELAAHNEEMKLVSLAMSKLPPKDRHVLQVRYWDMEAEDWLRKLSRQQQYNLRLKSEARLGTKIRGIQKLLLTSN